MMGKLRLNVTVDRPIGYQDEYGNTYPINYGFVKGVIGGDGEEQDVYIISKKASKPLETFEGELMAVITRQDDVETKWVVSSIDETYSIEAIQQEVNFIEKYFDSSIELVK